MPFAGSLCCGCQNPTSKEEAAKRPKSTASAIVGLVSEASLKASTATGRPNGFVFRGSGTGDAARSGSDKPGPKQLTAYASALCSPWQAPCSGSGGLHLMLGLSLVKSLMTRREGMHVGMLFLHKMPPRQVQERFMEDIQPLFDALAETNHSQTQHRRSNRVTSKSCSSRLLDMCEVSSSNNARADSGGPHDHLACSQSRTRSHAHASDIVRCP